jgi:uncharacterized protein (TIGR03067 family)
MRATHAINVALALALALAFCVGRVAADKPAADNPDVDKALLIGAWQFVSATEGGRDQPVPADMRLVITGDVLKTERPGQDPMGGRYKLDGSRRPRHIDLAVEEEPGRPIVQKGIYELDGDTLHIRLAAAGQARPDDLKGKEAKAETTWVLKRAERR